MTEKRYTILFITILLFASSIFAQKEERDYIRKGNRAFNDSVFVDAEVDYRKALEVNPRSAIAMYNLGNSLSQQQKFQDAIEQYIVAADIEKEKDKLAQIYHNIGVLFQASQDYAQAIEAYKKALRNNPKDDETRYNLALAQKLLKDQEDNQDSQDQQDSQQNQDEQDKKEQQEQNQDSSQDQNQQQDSHPQENEISQENAEQMLNSVMQDEKEVQEKVKKQQQTIQSGRLEKDW